MLAGQRIVCICCVRKRLCSSLSSKTKEEKLKIEAAPPSENSKNWIGPPDPVSNIRPIKFQVLPDETSIERRFREQQAETIQWNQNFWHQHNSKFFKEKEEHVRKIKEATGAKATADELSQFYRKFLDGNRHSHLQYNKEWYKRNISLLWPALQVSVIRAARQLRQSKKNLK